MFEFRFRPSLLRFIFYSDRVVSLENAPCYINKMSIIAHLSEWCVHECVPHTNSNCIALLAAIFKSADKQTQKERER